MNEWKLRLIQADVDVEDAIKRFVNKEDRYIKYLKMFGSGSDIHNFLVALDREDVAAAFDICHTLKGVAGNLGFSIIYQYSSEACEILRAGSMEGVRELVEAMKPNYDEIIMIINKYI